MTTITLDYTYFTGLTNAGQPQRPYTPARATNTPVYVSSQSQAPVYVATRPPVHTTRPPVPYTYPPVQQNYEVPLAPNRFGGGFECGVPDYQAPTTAGLVLGGQIANRGEFPW